MSETKPLSIKEQNKSAASSLLKKNIRKFLRNKLAVFGLAVIVIMTVACVAAMVMGIDYSTPNPTIMKAAPDAAHIFGTDHCATAGEVADNWEKLKKAEKGLHTQSEVLADVSRSLPALTRAHKVQKKAAQVGFDWDAPLEALPKVHEEADEVQCELQAGRDPSEELGDLLFSCVNVTRLCGLDAERLLELATEKFIRRFSAMENLIKCDGKSLEGLTLSEMDVYWNRVKSTQNCCGTELTL